MQVSQMFVDCSLMMLVAQAEPEMSRHKSKMLRGLWQVMVQGLACSMPCVADALQCIGDRHP